MLLQFDVTGSRCPVYGQGDRVFAKAESRLHLSFGTEGRMLGAAGVTAPPVPASPAGFLRQGHAPVPGPISTLSGWGRRRKRNKSYATCRRLHSSAAIRAFSELFLLKFAESSFRRCSHSLQTTVRSVNSSRNHPRFAHISCHRAGMNKKGFTALARPPFQIHGIPPVSGQETRHRIQRQAIWPRHGFLDHRRGFALFVSSGDLRGGASMLANSAQPLEKEKISESLCSRIANPTRLGPPPCLGAPAQRTQDPARGHRRNQ